MASIASIASNAIEMQKEYQRANATKLTIENKKIRIDVVNAEIQGVQVQINVAAALGKTDDLLRLSGTLNDLLKELSNLKEQAIIQ